MLNKRFVKQEINYLFLLKKTERLWHFPLLAAICTGVPLLISLYFNNLSSGILSCLAGLVILYFPTKSNIKDRMLSLLICSFGFMISFAVGSIFSFYPIVSALTLGLFALAVHWLVLTLKTNPPGSFFFIFVASIASCMPFELSTIPNKIGLIGLGTMFACVVGLIYSLITIHTIYDVKKRVIELEKNNYSNFIEAFIVGCFISGSLFIGLVFKMNNPYWIPVSCLAVMQGASIRHIWRRSIHRILGTLLGLALCWFILSWSNSVLMVCFSIISLQFIIEMLIVRNYTLAVLFITPMTILLAETANPANLSIDQLIYTRFIDILIGSTLGAIGGYFIYHEKIRYAAVRRLRKMRIALIR